MRGPLRDICWDMSEFKIKRLGHQGDGIADGPVFAALTLPGEVVSGTLSGDRLKDMRIVTPSVQRVAPPCRHFKSCGGCQLQHAADDFVAGWKVDVVREALRAQGLETTFRPIITSPPNSRRRATLSARRTKKGALAGFHARASDVLVEIPDCQLLHPDLMQALPLAQALAIAGGSRKGELSVTATVSENGLDVTATGGKPMDTPLFQVLAGLAEKYALARLTWGDEGVALRLPPIQRFGRTNVTPPPGAFLQATKAGEAALLGAVRDITKDADAIIDLFAGCGTFSLPLAESARVHAVEGDKDMVQALENGWRNAEGLRPVTSEARDLFRRPLMPAEMRKFDAVVIDPPRAGAEAQIAELAQANIAKIAYVSCSPVTFARDASVLIAAGYALKWVQVVDQFRWSSHIELVGEFALKTT